MAAFYARPDLRWIPLRDVEPLRVDLAWNPEEHNPTIGKFIDIARATRPEGQ